jgi:hypothetical protein
MWSQQDRKLLRQAVMALEAIARNTRPRPLPAVRFEFLIGGKKIMSTQPFALQDIQQVPYQVPALDEDGQPTNNVPTGAVAVITSSDPTVVAVVPDATPAPGFIASGLLVGQPKLGTATVSGQVNDASGNLLFPIAGLPQAVQVGASAAKSAGFTLGTPSAQPGK